MNGSQENFVTIEDFLELKISDCNSMKYVENVIKNW